MKELINIQTTLKAPKGQFNNFGKYKYRSCEDILESVKPHLAENNCTLTLSDDIIEVGGRIYVKATAMIVNESGEVVTATAMAREALEKKGMDDSQITGTASSYARKYALNGLFCIDDTKDADTDQYKKNMDAKGSATTPNAPELMSVPEDLAKAMKEVKEATTIEALTHLWNDTYKHLQTIVPFKNTVVARKKELK